MKYMEYKEVQVPEDVQQKLTELQESQDANTTPTLGAAGFFDWLNAISRDDGWHAVWQGFNFPYLVLEREVITEED